MTRGADMTPDRRILSEARIDDLGEAILALTREIWVLTDRQMVLEAILADHGIDTSKVDNYQPDEAMNEKLEAGRKKLLEAVLGALRVG